MLLITYLYASYSLREKLKKTQNQSGRILLSKVQYSLTLSLSILTVEIAAQAILSLVDGLIGFLQQQNIIAYYCRFHKHSTKMSAIYKRIEIRYSRNIFSVLRDYFSILCRNFSRRYYSFLIV